MLPAELKQFVASALACPVDAVWLKDGVYHAMTTSPMVAEKISILVEVHPATEAEGAATHK